MKTADFFARTSLCILVGSLLIVQGCGAPATPYHDYFQRTPIRVAVMPSENKTEQPEASVIFNKACEEALAKKGFEVIAADEVVTYASARGLLLGDVAKLKTSEVGRDLKADMVLYSVITTWESQYAVLNTRVHVGGTSHLMEVDTDSLVWRYTWNFVEDSSNGNSNGIAGLLISAAVSAVANSAFDATANLGARAATATTVSLPQPGFAPADSRPKPAARQK